jgi:nitrogen fixation protein NifB
METLRCVRADFPSMLLCVASNGLNVAPYVEEMVKLNVTHLTMTINAVDPDIGRRFIPGFGTQKNLSRPGRRRSPAVAANGVAASVPTERPDRQNQFNPDSGVNDHHIADVARVVAEQGADLFNCIGMCHVPNTPFAEIIPPGKEAVEAVRRQANVICPRCGTVPAAG